MVELIQPPDPHTLLPPLLAFLPTSFASSRPPPDLLPLLSPILRQRLQYITPSSTDNWLRLLCWDGNKADTLKDNIENASFEPHPVSGEIEVGDVEQIKYKRLDEETLRAQLELAEWPFAPIYLWCTGGEDGNGWKLAELLPEPEIDGTWSATITQANESSRERIVTEALRDATSPANRNLTVSRGDEDDYWAQYDKSPGRTPARKHSVIPNNEASEEDYYSRYGEVQPAMDNHDPDEEMEGAETGDSTLNGNAIHQLLNRVQDAPQRQDSKPPPYQDDSDGNLGDEKQVDVSQPRPESPASRAGSDTVARLETAAERYAASEIGIRQHISTTMKSMYRLSKSAGMDREEFDRIVQRELETLSIFDRDD